jgi:hypothetical protein
MEAARTSETSVDIYLTTRQYIPEDSELQLLKHHQEGRRRPGRPLKRLMDVVNAETETDHSGTNS